MSKNRNSLVAYFDILGYQSFLRNNSALETAEEVFKLVRKAPSQAVEYWKDLEGLKSEDLWYKIHPTVESLVFSDTIVVSCPMPDAKLTLRHVLMMAGISMRITKSMFEYGLPVRGVMTNGSFLFDDHCIAGQAVVEAHNLCQKIDLASVLISPELSLQVDTVLKEEASFWDEVFPYYLFPLKDKNELKTRSISWLPESEETDFTTLTRESFWKWNKDIPLQVDSKINNTAKLLDFFRMHRKKYIKKRLSPTVPLRKEKQQKNK